MLGSSASGLGPRMHLLNLRKRLVRLLELTLPLLGQPDPVQHPCPRLRAFQLIVRGGQLRSRGGIVVLKISDISQACVNVALERLTWIALERRDVRLASGLKICRGFIGRDPGRVLRFQCTPLQIKRLGRTLTVRNARQYLISARNS